MTHQEAHRSHRAGWLRAAVLGANDGVVSTASLIIGVAAGGATLETILLSGSAGLVAGAMSMAAGEFVSVSSQADTEKADLALESQSLADNPESERDELAKIYRSRGLDPLLARQVADQLMQHDALAAHARDDIGIQLNSTAKPLQAAVYSAVSFSLGAALPLLATWLSGGENLNLLVSITSLVCLALLGILAAHIGGASKLRGALRVTFWGAGAMAITALAGTLFGVAV